MFPRVNAGEIPGSNILNMAFRIIAKQNITYYQYLDRAINNIGQQVTEFAPSVIIPGSFQPVPRQLYERLGLDFQKSYFNFFTSNNLLDIQRDVSGDQISFQNNRYQVESATTWFGMDGWVQVLCVLLEQQIINQPIFGFNNNGNYPTLENSYVNFGNGNFAAGAV